MRFDDAVKMNFEVARGDKFLRSGDFKVHLDSIISLSFSSIIF